MKEEEFKEETIDTKQLLYRYLQYWHYFIFSIILFLLVAFVYNRYTKPTFSVSSTLLIRDENNAQLGAENILEGMELFSGKTNINNEIVVLKSFSLTNKAIEDLKFGVSYFQHGLLQSNEIYINKPFVVSIDSNHLQITGNEFRIKILDNNTFNLSSTIDDQNPYNVNKDQIDKNVEINFDLNQDFKFGSQIKSENFSFKVAKTSNFSLEKIIENNKEFTFKFHQRSKIVSKYIEEVAINPINKETSVLKLKTTSETPGKDISFLNKLTELYIKNGLADKNIMAVNTINFINEQLNIIKDSLNLIENKIETFKNKHPQLETIEEEYGAFFQKQKIDNTLAEQETKIRYYKSILKYLVENKDVNNIISPTSMGILNPELNTLINQLLNLYAKKSDLELTNTAKSPS